MYRYHRYGTAAAVPTGTGTRVPVVHLTLRCTIDTRVIYMFGRKLMRKLKNHTLFTHQFSNPGTGTTRNFITFKFYILPPPKWSKTHSCTLNTNRFRLHVCSISCINVKGMCTIITDFFER